MREDGALLEARKEPEQLLALIGVGVLDGAAEREHVADDSLWWRVLGVAATGKRLERRHRDFLDAERFESLQRHARPAHDAVGALEERQLHREIAFFFSKRLQAVDFRNDERVRRVGPVVGRDREDGDAEVAEAVLVVAECGGDGGNDVVDRREGARRRHGDAVERRRTRLRSPQRWAVVAREGLFLGVPDVFERLAFGRGRAGDGA
mmetsp:Transcript_2995/g.9079  ORF Transcript_2995/g.9079 Transcript_2995/m.9079 type:complete len:207 (-) Transcript_2995:341-961(-)